MIVSPEQNARYHAMLGEISKHVRMPPWKVKALVKYTLGIFELGLTTELHGITYPLSTTKYETEDMNNMIMAVRAWANTDLNYTFKEDRDERDND